MTPTKVEEALAVFNWLVSDFDAPFPHGMSASDALATLTAALAERERDAARFVWWFGPDTKTVNIHEYLQGIREGWSIDRWRLFADTNMKDTDHAR